MDTKQEMLLFSLLATILQNQLDDREKDAETKEIQCKLLHAAMDQIENYDLFIRAEKAAAKAAVELHKQRQ